VISSPYSALNAKILFMHIFNSTVLISYCCILPRLRLSDPNMQMPKINKYLRFRVNLVTRTWTGVSKYDLHSMNINEYHLKDAFSHVWMTNSETEPAQISIYYCKTGDLQVVCQNKSSHKEIYTWFIIKRIKSSGSPETDIINQQTIGCLSFPSFISI